MKKINSIDFTSNGNWICPAGVTKIIVYGMGGGAGGYGGGAGDTVTGGKSGPAGLSTAFLPMLLTTVPNTTYAVTIGAGGTGGTGSVSGRDAVIPASGNGGNTSLGALVTFIGANGTNSGGQFASTFGVSDRYSNSESDPRPTDVQPNQTGFGYSDGTDTTSTTTSYSSWWFEQSAFGTAGTVTGDGGLGIAGNNSSFGAGGTGGNAGIDGATETGGNGGNASANTGGGGGSGGGSAKSPGSNNAGGNGGNGGSGRLRIVWFE